MLKLGVKEVKRLHHGKADNVYDIGEGQSPESSGFLISSHDHVTNFGHLFMFG